MVDGCMGVVVKVMVIGKLFSKEGREEEKGLSVDMHFVCLPSFLRFVLMIVCVGRELDLLLLVYRGRGLRFSFVSFFLYLYSGDQFVGGVVILRVIF